MSGAAEAPEQAQAGALPVGSFKLAAPYLRRPFTPQAVKFKVQAAFPKNDPNAGLIVAYIDARLVVERLNHVCPDLWHEDFEPLDGGLMLCKLTIGEISRRDVGSGYQGKGLYSDSLKRAAVKFGVGVSLYAIPKIILKVQDGHVKQKTLSDKKTVVLTPNGEERCRQIYSMWLDTKGSQAFGDPLDHGDAENSAGDIEGEGAPEQVGSEETDSPVLDHKRVEHLKAGIAAAKGKLAESGINWLDGLNVLLGSLDIDGFSPTTPLVEELERLTPEQADVLEADLEKLAGAVSEQPKGGDTDAD